MEVVSHRIAGITFRTESDVPLPRLHDVPFVHFAVENEDTPDVRHRIHRVHLDSLTLAAPAGEERERILQRAHVEPGGLDNRLLRSPGVRDWIRAEMDRPGETELWLYPERLIGHDFSRHVVELFYPKDYGQTGAQEPEPGPAMGWGNGAPPRFTMRKVDQDPRIAPPLAKMERERFARDIGFSPPGTLDHPLLRTPRLRAWLHASLDRAERMEATVHIDGILVWNFDQNRQDYFYWPEYGDSPEGYVAVYFRQMFSTFLPDFSALMVHSSGLIRGDRAALFLAPDEGGKTTVLRLAPGGLLLNDDQIVLRKEAGGIVAHGTPLGRMTSGPCQARLSGLFFLEMAGHFELEPVKPAHAVRHLWEEHRIYTSVLPRQRKRCAFDLFYDVCHQVPAYKMRFPVDHVDWEAIDAALAGGG
jgi:hypothetical protein